MLERLTARQDHTATQSVWSPARWSCEAIGATLRDRTKPHEEEAAARRFRRSGPRLERLVASIGGTAPALAQHPAQHLYDGDGIDEGDGKPPFRATAPQPYNCCPIE
jgi:hypothetical protein